MVEKRIQEAKKKKIFTKAKKIALELGKYESKCLCETEGWYGDIYEFTDPRTRMNIIYTLSNYSRGGFVVIRNDDRTVFDGQKEHDDEDQKTNADIIEAYIPGRRELVVNELYELIMKKERQKELEKKLEEQRDLKDRFGL